MTDFFAVAAGVSVFVGFDLGAVIVCLLFLANGGSLGARRRGHADSDDRVGGYLLLSRYVPCTIAQSTRAGFQERKPQTLASHSRQHARCFGVARIYARMTCLVCRSHAARRMRMRMHSHGEADSNSDSDSEHECVVVCAAWCRVWLGT
jgi:hypothetical protein